MQTELFAKLNEYRQEHLIKYYNDLTDEQKLRLTKQIESINFERMKDLIAKTNEKEIKIKEEDITPIEYTKKENLSESEISKYEAVGKEICHNGEYAVVTMAGGQGTRLGHNGPKGTYDIGLPSHKSLFEIQCSRLKRTQNRIPWYIMTSRENDEETKQHFISNNYFGYNKEDIMFFKQGMLPMVMTDGKIVLEDKGSIKEGADGHGGIFRAMMENGVLDDMKRRNIKWIFTCGIDNVLTRFDDMVFLGLVKESGCMLGGKSLVKRDPYEKVGAFCKANNKPYVIEYTEISDKMANLKNEEGEYVYGDAHILCNLFNISVFEKMGTTGLPYHVALKKTKYIDENGIIKVPEKPNAYKFEVFIFDAFCYFNDMIIFRVKREDEFAPVKNKEGEDSPQTAKELYMASGEPV